MAALALSGRTLLAEAPKKKHKYPRSATEIARPGTTKFRQLLQAQFPKLLGNHTLRHLEKHAAIVINPGRSAIHACSVRWDLHTHNGHKHIYRKLIVARPSTRAAEHMSSAHKPVIPPGGMLLVTPYFALSPEEFASRDIHSMVKRNHARMPRAASFIKASHHSKHLHVTVDAKLYRSKIKGSGGKRLAAFMSARTSAEHDLSKAVIALSKSEQKTTQKEYLQHVHNLLSVKTHTNGSRYVRAKRRFAGKLLKFEEKHGATGLVQALHSVKLKRRPHYSISHTKHA
jgi:hypothetical protein